MAAELNSNSTTKYTIYMHISPSGKRYIGITSCIPVKRRWGSNGIGYRSQRLFWRAIQKYGWDNFEHLILYTNVEERQALKLEIDLIRQYKSNNPSYGYNISCGGNGVKGGSLLPTDRENLRKVLSLKLKGRPSTLQGKTLSQVHKENISKSLKGHKVSEKTKDLISQSELGKVISEESKIKMGISKKGNTYHLGHHHSEETRDKIRRGHLGKHHSEETKQKMRESHRKRRELNAI